MRAMSGGKGSPGPINLQRPEVQRVLVLGAHASGCRSVAEISELLGLEADRVKDAAKGAGIVKGTDTATRERLLFEGPEDGEVSWEAIQGAASVRGATLNRLLHYLEYRGFIAPAIYPIEQREGEVREVSDEHPPENWWPEKPAPWHRWTVGMSGVRRPRGLWRFRLQPRVRDSWHLGRSDDRWEVLDHGPERWSVATVKDPILRVDVLYEPPLPVVRWDEQREALLRRILASLRGMEAVAPVLADRLELGDGTWARVQVEPIRFVVDDMVADMRFIDGEWVTTWRIPSPAERSV